MDHRPIVTRARDESHFPAPHPHPRPCPRPCIGRIAKREDCAARESRSPSRNLPRVVILVHWVGVAARDFDGANERSPHRYPGSPLLHDEAPWDPARSMTAFTCPPGDQPPRPPYKTRVQQEPIPEVVCLHFYSLSASWAPLCLPLQEEVGRVMVPGSQEREWVIAMEAIRTRGCEESGPSVDRGGAHAPDKSFTV